MYMAVTALLVCMAFNNNNLTCITLSMYNITGVQFNVFLYQCEYVAIMYIHTLDKDWTDEKETAPVRDNRAEYLWMKQIETQKTAILATKWTLMLKCYGRNPKCRLLHLVSLYMQALKSFIQLLYCTYCTCVMIVNTRVHLAN